MGFNIENKDFWSPFLTGKEFDEPMEPFYNVRSGLGPPIHDEKCKTMADDIRKDIEGTTSRIVDIL